MANTFPKKGLDIMRPAPEPLKPVSEYADPSTDQQDVDSHSKSVLEGCYGSYTLAANESVTTALLNALIVKAQSAGVLNIDIFCEMSRANTDRTLLESNSFSWTGTEQRNEHERAVVYAKYRRNFMRSSDGHAAACSTAELAVPMPLLAPSGFEQEAVALMKQRMSEPIDEAKMAAMGKQDEVEVESLIFVNLRKEITDLEAQSEPDQKVAIEPVVAWEGI